MRASIHILILFALAPPLWGQLFDWCDTIKVREISEKEKLELYQNLEPFTSGVYQTHYAAYFCAAQKGNDKKLLAHTAWLMANSSTDNPYYTYAPIFWELAYKNIQEIDDTHKSMFYTQLGNYYHQERKYTKAYSVLFEGIKFTQKNNLINDNVGIKINLAHVYSSSGNLKKAEDLYQEVFRQIKKHQLKEDPWVYFKYGYLQRKKEKESNFIPKKGEDPKSIKYYKYAVRLMDQPESKATVYNEIGQTYRNVNLLDSSKKYFEIVNFKKVCGDHQYTFNLMGKGLLYKDLRNKKMAKDTLEKALQIAKKNGFKDFQSQIYWVLLELTENGDPKYMTYLKDLKQLFKDQVFDHERNEIFSKNQEELIEKSYALEKSNLEKQAQEAINLRNQSWLFILVFMLLFSVLVVVFFYRLAKKLKKSQRIIRAKHQDLQVAYRSIELMNNKLSQFASIAAHDMRNSISGIMMISQIARDELKSVGFDSLGDDISEVEKEARKLLDFMNYLLQNTKENPANQMETISLPDILDEVKKTLHVKAMEKNLTILGEVPYEIQGQFFEMYQLFLNFVDNTIKYGINTRGEKPILRITAEEINNQLIIRFIDNGDGMPEEESQKVLEQYYQIIKEGEQKEGVGLGLHICSEIVAKYNGHIAIKSILGKGTTFTITLQLEVKELNENSSKNNPMSTIK